MKIEYQKIYADILNLSNQDYNDLNLISDNNSNNNINDFTDEMTLYEILKLIEKPEEHINTELPFILENLINSKRLDETNTNTILIADLSRIIIQHLKWIKCFPNIKPYYKIEANNNYELLKVIKRLGINFICTKESDINDVINVESSFDNQGNINNFNFNETRVKLNNSFKNNESNIKNYNAKIICSSNTEIENSLIESNPSKMIFSYKFFGYENKQEKNTLKDMFEIHNKRINTFICNNIDEIQEILTIIPSANIFLRIFVNNKSEITRAERNRLNYLFEILEEFGFIKNIIGLSFELNAADQNETENYIIPNKIYEIIKRAREIFDEAEEYGIEMKVLDIGSPENETFLNEENIKLLNDSLDYFFSDIKIEFISQLGKFFCAPVFTLMQKNNRKAFNQNTNENINNISNENNTIISNSNSSSSFNLVGLNSTEISVNGIISSINQNSTYYLDLDFLPLEENNNLCLNNYDETSSPTINKNFSDEFILNNSSIFDSLTPNLKENVTNMNNEIFVDEYLNKFISLSTDKNYNEDFDSKNKKFEKQSLDNFETNQDRIPLKDASIKLFYNKKSFINNNRTYKKKCHGFDSDLKDELKKIDCETKNCIQWKMNPFKNDIDRNILEDWIIFEDVGNDEICNSCKTNGYCKPEIYYINNRISIKLEKYFYVIMNKFDS